MDIFACNKKINMINYLQKRGGRDMKKIIEHSCGEIIYEESFWTGKKEISINGKKLKKLDKTLFEYTDSEGKTTRVYLMGNFVSGTKITLDSQNIQVTEPSKWYEYVLAILIFVVVLIWGNSPALCSIIPIVGGAIGGGISGVMGFGSLILMKSTSNVLYKILIALGMLMATILICFVIALGLISSLS